MAPTRVLAIGEIAYLKSGSPALKVIAVKGNRVAVEWDGGKQRHTFPAVCLQRKAAANGD